MKFTYDPEVDALNVELLAGESARTVELTPNVFADLDANGRLLSVEVLAASESYPPYLIAELRSPEEWLTLKDAAKVSGISATTLRVQLNHGRIQGKKVGREWTITRAALLNYLDSRAPAGKPARAKRGRRQRATAKS